MLVILIEIFHKIIELLNTKLKKHEIDLQQKFRLVKSKYEIIVRKNVINFLKASGKYMYHLL
jgi:hypothetical protein